MASSDIWVATEAASTTCQGTEMALIPGQTTVRDGHPVLKQHPDWFKVLAPSYEWPDDKTDDGAPANSSRADSRGARSR
jgi:hypothetical protein